MDEVEMVFMTMEMLKDAKIENKKTPDGHSVLARYKGKTFEVCPCNQEGKAVIVQILTLNVDNVQALTESWAKAFDKYSYDSTYDEWDALNMHSAMIPNQAKGRKKCAFWYTVGTFEDLRAKLMDKNAFTDILDKMIVAREYIDKEDKTV
jgi:hypothetical protein